MPRLLLTGANGLLGQQLVRRLAGTPWETLATGLQDAPRYPEPVPWARMDLEDPDDVARVLRSFRPRVVVHAGARSRVDECELHPERCRRVNLGATEEIAARCRELGARLVFLSTDFVFDGENGPYREDDAPAPPNEYGRSKLAAERAVLDAGLPGAAVVRTVLVYGTGRDLGRGNIATWVIGALRRGESIRVVNDQWRTPTWVGDLADGVLRAVERDVSGVLHVSGREGTTVHGFAVRIAQRFGLDSARIEPVESAGLGQPARRPPRTGFAPGRAERELGFRPLGIDAGLERLRRELEPDGDGPAPAGEAS